MELLPFQNFQEEILLFFQQFPDLQLEENGSPAPGAHYYFPALQLAIKLLPVDCFEQEAIDPSDFQKDCQISRDAGIRLVKVWQDEWSNHKGIIQSRLLSLMGKTQHIHGRQTQIRALNANELKSFLKANHLQVPLNTKYKYGLEKGQKIQAVMAFGKARNMERGGLTYRSCELVRFCNVLGSTVVGGFSKLLAHFIKTQQPDDIMTYADWEWSDGSVYEKHGFELVGTTPPQMFYVDKKSGERFYPERLPAHPGIDLSQKYFKIYNSGNLKYLLRLK